MIYPFSSEEYSPYTLILARFLIFLFGSKDGQDRYTTEIIFLNCLFGSEGLGLCRMFRRFFLSCLFGSEDKWMPFVEEYLVSKLPIRQ